MQGSELFRLIADQPTSTVKVKLASGNVYTVSGAEFDIIDGEPVIWIRTEPPGA